MSLYEIFNNFKSDNLSFLYKGWFNDIITDKILSLSETNINNKIIELSAIKKKVPFLMVECFQNIIRHGNTQKKDVGFFMSRNIGPNYYITSGNGIENAKIDELKIKLEKINSLNKDELKEYYLEEMNKDAFNNQGGAGLGLIEMARKSGQKLDYHFFKINNEYSIFYVQINMRNKEENSPTTPPGKVSFQNVINFHKNMVDNNILLTYQGDFSQETVRSIYRMIEDNLKQEISDSVKNSVVSHVLVEQLQNISKHAYSSTELKKGIFSITGKENSYTISSGNYILKENVPALNNHLTHLNSINKDELKALYQKVLRGKHKPEFGDFGLGLIDLARESSNPIVFSFVEEDKNLSFFEISVKI